MHEKTKSIHCQKREQHKCKEQFRNTNEQKIRSWYINQNQQKNLKSKNIHTTNQSFVWITFIFISAQLPDLHSWYALGCANKDYNWDPGCHRYMFIVRYIYCQIHTLAQTYIVSTNCKWDPGCNRNILCQFYLALSVKELMKESIRHCRVLGQCREHCVARVVLRRKK